MGDDGTTNLKATKVNVKRRSSHLSVCEVGIACPPAEEVASEMSVDRECSIFVKLARPRTYLMRMATTQTLPTIQQHSTVLPRVSRYGMETVEASDAYLGCRQ